MNTPTIPKHHKRRLAAHFGFTRLPFRKNMAAADMFDSRSQRDLRAGLLMWTELRGIALVTGYSGVGKSITLRRFLLSLDDARFHVLKFAHLPTTPVGLLRSLCRALDLPMRHHASDLFDAAQAYLAAYQQENGPHPLIVLDDAEGLAVPALDLIRRLTTYDLDAEDRFSILIAATEDILATMRHHVLEPLRSRIGYAQPLRPFSLEDTRNYIQFHLRLADADPKLLSDAAIRHVFQASRGKPRHINQICLYILIQAAIAGLDTIDGDFVAAQIAAHPLYQNPGAE
ncbi:MAG: AAA family ATPase [Candidatus Brocadiia bacterium]|jgi:type II secretory pathway predicted ATPase ExeA|nr:AAA family ATPase [Candidatus Brocadiia bacterium]